MLTPPHSSTRLRRRRIAMLGALPTGCQRRACSRQRVGDSSDVQSASGVKLSLCLQYVWFVSATQRNRDAHMTYGNTSTSVELTLRNLLLQKGVPVRVVEQRIQAAIKSIGMSPLRSAVEGREQDPELFTRLKGLADAKKFRWVTREESQQFQEAKRAARPPLQRARNDAPSKNPRI